LELDLNFSNKNLKVFVAFLSDFADFPDVWYDWQGKAE
jgi:hypothetical protein